jgi:glycosyltransferase involved in cell wall biosynthesis
MRIVQIVTQLEAGGAQRAAVLLAEGLRDRGHAVETWFFYHKRAAFEGASDLHVLFETRPSATQLAGLPGLLIRRLRDFGAEALITHTHYANVVGQPAAQLAGVPARVAVQQNPVDSYPRAARIADWMLGSAGTYTDIVSVSRSTADSTNGYPRSYRDKVSVIHNAVSPPPPPGESGAALAKHGIPSDARLLVNVGRLHYQKNQATLIRAMAAVPDAHLVIMGEGELRSELTALARSLGVSGRVHMPGELAWDDAIRISQRASAFVFPSLFEGMSLALVEAMTLGLPIVGSDIPSIREAIGEGGILVPAEDPESLADGVNRVLADPELEQRMRESSRDHSRHFSLQGMTDAYESLVRARLQGQRTSPDG